MGERDRHSRVIGYFAYAPPSAVVCIGKACLVAGSETTMRDYIKESMPDSWQRNVIKKVRFGSVIHGMNLCGAYAFDEEAYGRYYVLAKEEGLPALEADFEEAHARGQKFLMVETTRIINNAVGDHKPTLE
jgi:hypothetical protein